LSRFHAASDGHAASEGRRRRKLVLADRRRGKIGRSAADPIAFKNALLFIYPYPIPRSCAAGPARDRSGSSDSHIRMRQVETAADALSSTAIAC